MIGSFSNKLLNKTILKHEKIIYTMIFIIHNFHLEYNIIARQSKVVITQKLSILIRYIIS